MPYINVYILLVNARQRNKGVTRKCIRCGRLLSHYLVLELNILVSTLSNRYQNKC